MGCGTPQFSGRNEIRLWGGVVVGCSQNLEEMFRFMCPNKMHTLQPNLPYNIYAA